MNDIWNGEYWARKGAVDLYLFRKRDGAPSDSDRRPVLFLVHGSSVSSRPGYDLTVPGKDGYSTMDWFARRGFDVWTMDHENYGRSSRTDTNSDIASGAEDLTAALPVLEQETGQNAYAYYGASSGALRAGAFAQACPDRVTALILDGFVWTGEGSPTLAKRAENLDKFRANPTRPIDRAFMHTIFTRDGPGMVEDGVADAFADAELAFGDSVPTGTYLDMCANLPVVDPTKLTCPVQILRGVHDGIATEEDLLAFFGKLATSDKQFVVLPGQAHVGMLGVNRHRMFHAMLDFLTMPARVDG